MCVIVCVHMLILANVSVSMSTPVFEEVPQCMNVSVSVNMRVCEYESVCKCECQSASVF